MQAENARNQGRCASRVGGRRRGKTEFVRYLGERLGREVRSLGASDLLRPFVVKERHAVSAAVQACIRLTDECKDREIGGLLAAMDACSLPTGTIITEDQRDTLDFGRRRVDVVPFWDWCR